MSAPSIKERAFILAGGLGTRLQGVIGDRPKVLAPVGRWTFLDWFLLFLHSKGIRRVLLLLGHRHAQVLAHLEQSRIYPSDLELETSVEPQVLGTGGALRWAQRFCDGTTLLFNGDTVADIEIKALLDDHRANRALLTLSVGRTIDGGRFGALELDNMGRVTSFLQRGTPGTPALINLGVYAFEPSLLDNIPEGQCSLEKDILPGLVEAGEVVRALPSDGAFIDIGSPDSYTDFYAFAHRHGIREPGEVLP